MRYSLSDMLGAIFACVILAVFGYLFLLWAGVPMGGDKVINLINPSTGRPLTGAEARQADRIENDQKALAEYQEKHQGQDSPFTP